MTNFKSNHNYNKNEWKKKTKIKMKHALRMSILAEATEST